MNNKNTALVALVGLVLLAGCKEKKPAQDIIAPKVETPRPQAPIKMQAYQDSRDVEWLGKHYKVEWQREASDSLPMVKDETGQEFVDNVIMVTVRRQDGTVAINKRFTKRDFNEFIDATYQQHGILEGLVFDEVDGTQLEFAASVSLPQTDEYIPLEVKIDNFGAVKIELDTDMDTTGSGEMKAEEESDGV